jgi:hypothetical protein
MNSRRPGKDGYARKPMLQSITEGINIVLPGVHLVTQLINRLICGTFQGRFVKKYLTWYLDKYVFRFNRRTTKSVGKRFGRFVQQQVASKPTTNTQVAAAVISPLLVN